MFRNCGETRVVCLIGTLGDLAGDGTVFASTPPAAKSWFAEDDVRRMSSVLDRSNGLKSVDEAVDTKEASTRRFASSNELSPQSMV